MTALVKLNWEPLDSRRKKHVLKLLEKCLEKQVPQFFMGHFILYIGKPDRVTYFICLK